MLNYVAFKIYIFLKNTLIASKQPISHTPLTIEYP